MRTFIRLHRPAKAIHRLGLGILALTFTCFAKNASAVCTITQNTPVETAIYTVDFKNLPTFDPMTQDGTVLVGQNVSMTSPGGSTKISCDPNIGRYAFTGSGSFDSRYSTYPTGIAGIGIRIGGTTSSTGAPWWWDGVPVYSSAQGFSWPSYSELRIELVKTGPITAGGALGGDVGYMLLMDHNRIAMKIQFSGSVPVRPTVPGCSVTTNKNLPVPLGNVSVASLKHDAASSARNFNIRLTCSGGTQGATTRMYMAMTDNTNSSNLGDILTLTPGANTAKGVGVRILRQDGAPVKYGTPNQWQIGQFGNEQVDIPFSAHYVLDNKTEPTGGTANATAVYSITYK